MWSAIDGSRVGRSRMIGERSGCDGVVAGTVVGTGTGLVYDAVTVGNVQRGLLGRSILVDCAVVGTEGVRRIHG